MRKLGCINWKIGSGEALSHNLMKEILEKKMDLYLVQDCQDGMKLSETTNL